MFSDKHAYPQDSQRNLIIITPRCSLGYVDAWTRKRTHGTCYQDYEDECREQVQRGLHVTSSLT